MNHLILAPCSRRKRMPVEPELRASNLHSGPMSQVAEAWAMRVRHAKSKAPAEELYAGRGLAEARRAAAFIGADLFIVSAGLGLVGCREAVPAYSLTIANGDPDSIAPKIQDEFSPGRWRQVLRSALQKPNSSIIDLLSNSRGLMIIALPGTYLEFIADELVLVPNNYLTRLRLIGPPREVVRAELAHIWMPYDARFDGEGSPNPGTRGDFAQRAARHFAEAIAHTVPDADPATHAEMIKQWLDPLPPPTPPQREVGTDAELIQVIRALLPRSGGRSSETLRLLRHKAGRACEQGRFRRLFAAATQEDLV